MTVFSFATFFSINANIYFLQLNLDYYSLYIYNIIFIENIEDITRWREDMNFMLSGKNNISRVSAANE